MPMPAYSIQMRFLAPFVQLKEYVDEVGLHCSFFLWGRPKNKREMHKKNSWLLMSKSYATFWTSNNEPHFRYGDLLSKKIQKFSSDNWRQKKNSDFFEKAAYNAISRNHFSHSSTTHCLPKHVTEWWIFWKLPYLF